MGSLISSLAGKNAGANQGQARMDALNLVQNRPQPTGLEGLLTNRSAVQTGPIPQVSTQQPVDWLQSVLGIILGKLAGNILSSGGEGAGEGVGNALGGGGSPGG